ncbi:uncharacterized protein [Haliotis cracherodii]|uniref:uncharacterized protein n=1 Tax=Haliotis cracherodii TaxID=6455 RepID=UPI0039ED9ADF
MLEGAYTRASRASRAHARLLRVPSGHFLCLAAMRCWKPEAKIMKVTELHLLWYLCAVASLTYVYLITVGSLSMLAKQYGLPLPPKVKASGAKQFQPNGALKRLIQYNAAWDRADRQASPIPTASGMTMTSHNSSRNVKGQGRSEQREKYLIYLCQRGKYCGGLTDRLIGIVTAYVASEIMGRRFGIKFESPCYLSTFLEPNLIDWEISPMALRNKTCRERVHLGNDGFGTKINKHAKKLSKIDIIYYRGNLDILESLMKQKLIGSVQWARNKPLVNVYKTAITRLFKHSKRLKEQYQLFKSSLKRGPRQLICAHMRMGKSQTLTSDSNLTLSLRPRPDSVIRFVKNRLNSRKADFFLATDSEEIRQRFKKEFPNNFREVQGPITHIDQGRGRYNCEAMGKVILDQYILSTCKTLIMSNSGFSRLAAIMRGTDLDLYLALHNGKIIPQKRTNPSLSYRRV